MFSKALRPRRDLLPATVAICFEIGARDIDGSLGKGEYMLIDIHCHLDYDKFDHDTDTIVKNAEKAGVGIIISNGTNPESNRKVLALAKKYKIVRPALGIYPVDSLKMTDKEIEAELVFIRSQKDKIAAIGEIGVDFYWIKDEEERKKEIENFKRILSFAQEIGKTVIVHAREAEQETIDILKEAGNKKVIMHCFGGTMKQVQECLDQGWYFSIPVTVINSKHFRKIVKCAGAERIFTETDAPFLNSEKGKANESANVAKSIKKIAELLDMKPEDLEKRLEKNYKSVFL